MGVWTRRPRSQTLLTSIGSSSKSRRAAVLRRVLEHSAESNSPMRPQVDVSIAGIPIGGIERITPETLNAFRQARVIFDLTSNPWPLRDLRHRVIDLDKFYWTGEVDEGVYKRIADKVLEEAANGPGVVLAVDGHPGIYQDLSWDILARGRRYGLKVRILPAISCLDAMVALCGLEIGAEGLQILEATTIVGYNVPINPFINLLVMQIGWFGTSLLSEVAANKRSRFQPLVKYLLRYYKPDHPVKIFKVSYDVGEPPKIISTRLSLLDKFHRSITTDTTLFIPAREQNGSRSTNDDFLERTVDQSFLMEIADLSQVDS
jgi:uncharacterized protein YabN with tetrapyrrole methylase and pyrophosphatase domain